MKNCYKCNVSVKTSLDECPLCHNTLDNKKKVDDVFPLIPTLYTKHKLLLRIMLFLSVFGSAVCLVINYLVVSKVRWSLFVVAGITSFWATFITGINKRKNFIKMLFAEVIVIILFSLVWDYFTGWLRWSITFVLPFLCIAYIVVIIFARIFLKHRLKEYIIYIYLNCLIGLLPLIFLLRNVVNIRWPSILSIIFSVFSILVLAIFNRRQVKDELTRRFHI